ncbi:MAG: nitroreductase [Saprospiraceae bacterium]
MNENFNILTQIIRNRRAIYPQSYLPGQIDQSILETLIENATWAPNHKKTQPWRFVIFTGASLNKLSSFLSEFYKLNVSSESFNEIKYKKAGEKALQSAAVIAICIERSPESLIPAWEETAAVACAVQNLWLSASAMGIGSYWSSPEAIRALPEFLNLTSNQECLGLFYMGWMDKDLKTPSDRKALQDVIRYF